MGRSDDGGGREYDAAAAAGMAAAGVGRGGMRAGVKGGRVVGSGGVKRKDVGGELSYPGGGIPRHKKGKVIYGWRWSELLVLSCLVDRSTGWNVGYLVD